MQILMWAVPSGGIGAAIAWVANRKTRAVQDAKEALKDENVRTRRALNRLSRAIEAIQSCPHRGSCPVSSELSLDEADGESDEVHRTPRQRKSK